MSIKPARSMYTHHFHLTELPFSIAPNPRYLYLSPQHREALAHLLYGIGIGGGFVVLSGEVGTGKTTLCRALLDQLPEDVDIALIFNPRLNSRELLASICDELHIPYSGPRASLKQLIDALNQYLLESHARGRRVIVLIDEAQNLRFDVLEQVRLLTNLETNQTKLLQIILVGQPELNQILDRANLRQLAQRITARYHLNPLSLVETCDYIRHRLTVAGGSEHVFSGMAIRAIHRQSRGIPRLINLIADRALLGAYTLGKTRVSGRVVWRAARELMSAEPRKTSRYRLAVLLALLLTSLAGAFYLDAIPTPRSLWLSKVEMATHKVPKPVAPPAAATEPPARTVAPEVPDPASGNATPPQATPMPAPEQTAPPPVSAPVFAEWIGGPRFGKSGALARLLSLWSLPVPENTTDPCALAASQGLRCQTVQGSWMQLKNLDLPGVLEFVLPSGERRHAVLLHAKHGRVELANPATSAHFAVSDILQWWSGTAVVVWKPAQDELKTLKPGANAPTIGWIRSHLGVTAPVGAETFYDDALKARVIEFQKSRGLKPDGIIGTLTLLSLQTAGKETGIPRLDSASP